MNLARFACTEGAAASWPCIGCGCGPRGTSAWQLSVRSRRSLNAARPAASPWSGSPCFYSGSGPDVLLVGGASSLRLRGPTGSGEEVVLAGPAARLRRTRISLRSRRGFCALCRRRSRTARTFSAPNRTWWSGAPLDEAHPNGGVRSRSASASECTDCGSRYRWHRGARGGSGTGTCRCRPWWG